MAVETISVNHAAAADSSTFPQPLLLLKIFIKKGEMFQSEAEASGYLAAIIDGEGHIAERTRCVIIANTDLDIVDAVTVACAMLGIECRAKRASTPANRKPLWNVYISRQSELIILSKRVTVRSLSKRAALGRIIDSYKREPEPIG